MEQAECPFCPKREKQLLTEDAGWTLVRCVSCGHVFVSPRMKRARVQEYYAENEWKPGEVENTPEWHAWVERTRLLRLSVIFRELPAPARVLEIGCGSGDILSTLQQHGYQVHGIELNRTQAERAARLLGGDSVTTEPIEKLAEDGAFDAVVMFSLLEHVDRPLEFMGHIHRLLKPGGKVVIHAPNLLFFLLRLRLGRKLSWRVPGHLHHYSLRNLMELLSRTGFRVAAQFWHEQPFVPVGRGALTRARVALSTFLYRVIWEVSGRRLNLGSTLNVIAEKCG